MMLHPRSDWYNPATWQRHSWFDPHGVAGIAWHYPGASHLRTFGLDELYQEQDTIDMLRAMDRDYLTSRGYNLGYSFVIDEAGEVWAVRGLTDKPASNGNQTTNGAYAGVLFLVPDLTTRPSPAALAAAVELVGFVRAWAPGALVNVPHSSLYATGCPGDTIRGLLAELEPSPSAPTAPPQEDPMAQARFRHPEFANVFVMPEGTPESPGLDHAFSALPMSDTDAHEPTLAACCHRSWGITGNTAGEVVERAINGGFLVRVGPR